MLGYQEVPGIMVLTIRDMFETIKNMREKEYNIIISYVEIYNETIRDLLVPSSTYLELRDDPIKVNNPSRNLILRECKLQE
jgi:kinesin family protein 18/19